MKKASQTFSRADLNTRLGGVDVKDIAGTRNSHEMNADIGFLIEKPLQRNSVN